MNNNKQSSVEWLFDHMVGLCEDYDDGKINYTKYCDGVKKATEQAKAMHKEEIKEAFNKGYRDGEHDNTTHILGDVSVWDDSENYYNETYGGNK